MKSVERILTALNHKAPDHVLWSRQDEFVRGPNQQL